MKTRRATGQVGGTNALLTDGPPAGRPLWRGRNFPPSADPPT